MTRVKSDDKYVAQYYFDGLNKLRYATDKQNKLTRYSYDGMGRRIKKESESCTDLSTLTPRCDGDRGVYIEDQITLKGYAFKLDTATTQNFVYNPLSAYDDTLITYGKNVHTQRFIYGAKDKDKGLIKIDSYTCMGDRWTEDSCISDPSDLDFGNQHLAKETLNSKVKKDSRYVIKDIRGSIELTTCETGCKDKLFEYSAFGELKTAVSINDIHGYTGYVQDKETALNYANARMYHPTIGRFISKDILRVDSLNRYLYVVNNPVNAVDPSGLTSKNIATPFDNIDWRQIRHTLDFNGSTYYSVRDIFEHLGGDVHYSYTTKQANLYLKSYIDRQAYNFELKYNLNDIAVDKHNRRVLADIFEGALSVNGHSQDIPLIYYRGSVYIIPAILTETASTLCGEVGNEETGKAYSSTYTYIDRYGNTVSKEWTISDTEFLDSMTLTQQQITDIMNSKNSGLVERGFDVAVYEYAQRQGINPKVILATLAQEQGWCRNGNYNSAFGVGPGGNPIDFAEGESGGINRSVSTFVKWFNHGKELLDNGGLGPMRVNYDPSPYAETKAVYGSNTVQWQMDHPTDVEYMEQGQYVTPVNAAMYSKLKYTPWVDFPPQGSHPLDQWHSIFRSFDNY